MMITSTFIDIFREEFTNYSLRNFIRYTRDGNCNRVPVY